VTFPSAVQPLSNATCSMVYNSLSSNVGCSLSGNTFTVTAIPSLITAGSSFSLSFTSIRNPYSFAPLSGLTVLTKSANNLYSYSSGTTTNSLSNSAASSFKNISYTYSPRQLSTAVSLDLSFELSQTALMPSSLLLSIDTFFTVGTLFCSSFINFVGSCAPVSSNTLNITGTFNNSVLGLTLSGFSTGTVAPIGTTYTTLTSLDSSASKIDESLTTIAFSLACVLPCKTCGTNASACLSCYSNPNVTASVYFYALLSNCYSTCPATTYNNATLLLCAPCDSNCLNCLNAPAFCTSCNASSAFPYLQVLNSTQTCVADCGAGNYPSAAASPTICTACVSPCATCTGQTVCLTCAGGFFKSGALCVSSCPVSTTVPNNATNTCDACAAICLTCSVSVANCTSCSTPNVFYNGSCQASCPAGGKLAPLNGVCSPCDPSCLTCSLTTTNCTSCNLTASTPYLVGSVCLATCPSTYYNESSTGSCISCASAGINCLNCSSASTCLSCDQSFVFHLAACLSSTPAGFVNISGVAVACAGDCLTCSVTTANCTGCKTLNLQNNLCTATCNAGAVAVSQVCLPCSSPCATCAGTQANCTSCLGSLSPLLFLTGNSCQQNCPTQTYPNATTLKCEACLSPCQQCTTSTACSSCAATFFLDGSSCVLSANCPSGTAGVSGVCQACTASCKTCSGSTSQCLTCVNGTYFLASSNSCLSSCDPNMFINATSQSCVGCSASCSACVNSSTTCTSCTSGRFLSGTACVTACPAATFPQANTTCLPCATDCAVCFSTSNCSQCSGLTFLYNGGCVAACPSTAAVVSNGSCMPCSTQKCFSCSPADVCLICTSGSLFLNAACIAACPANYSSNGTHCVWDPAAAVAAAVTTPNTFPVPFSIAGIVLVIACLMSKLQFGQTYLAGAVFAFLGVLEVLALWYFLALYFLDYFSNEPTPLWVALAATGYLYFLNLVAAIAQCVFLCYEKAFKTWRDQSGFHKCFYGFTNVVSLCLSHKFRNILFCKLFTFKIFSAKLDSVHHFRIFNIFSLLSLAHSGGAIFAAAIALQYVSHRDQVYYECLDVIVLSSVNVLLAFFNTHKENNFFEELTPEGLALHKRNTLD
jgi:hypothetical protein